MDSCRDTFDEDTDSEIQAIEICDSSTPSSRNSKDSIQSIDLSERIDIISSCETEQENSTDEIEVLADISPFIITEVMFIKILVTLNTVQFRSHLLEKVRITHIAQRTTHNANFNRSL